MYTLLRELPRKCHDADELFRFAFKELDGHYGFSQRAILDKRSQRHAEVVNEMNALEQNQRTARERNKEKRAQRASSVHSEVASPSPPPQLPESSDRMQQTESDLGHGAQQANSEAPPLIATSPPIPLGRPAASSVEEIQYGPGGVDDDEVGYGPTDDAPPPMQPSHSAAIPSRPTPLFPPPDDEDSGPPPLVPPTDDDDSGPPPLVPPSDDEDSGPPPPIPQHPPAVAPVEDGNVKAPPPMPPRNF